MHALSATVNSPLTVIFVSCSCTSLQLVNAIARHTHPSSVQLLFAFDYTRALLNSRREESLVGGVQDMPIPSYLNPRDWQRELTRLGVTNDQWKVTEVNKRFLVCNR